MPWVVETWTHTHRCTDIDTEADRQTDRQTNRHRHTHTHTHTHTHKTYIDLTHKHTLTL